MSTHQKLQKIFILSLTLRYLPLPQCIRDEWSFICGAFHKQCPTYGLPLWFHPHCPLNGMHQTVLHFHNFEELLSYYKNRRNQDQHYTTLISRPLSCHTVNLWLGIAVFSIKSKLARDFSSWRFLQESFKESEMVLGRTQPLCEELLWNPVFWRVLCQCEQPLSNFVSFSYSMFL